MSSVNLILGLVLLAMAVAVFWLVIRNDKALRGMRLDDRVCDYLLGLAQDGIIQIDSERRVARVNDEACRLLGHGRGDVTGRPLSAFIEQKYLVDLDGFSDDPSRLIECKPHDGPVTQCLLHRAELPSGDGTPTVLFRLEDITGRDQREALLMRSLAVYEHAAEAIMIVNRNGYIEFVNPAFTTITGYEQDEVVGRQPKFLRYGQIWVDLLANGYWQGEVQSYRKNGDAFPKWLTLSAVRDGQGNVINYVGLFSDLSRIKESEAQLRHMAHYDSLTGLANRSLLNIQLGMALERAARRSKRLALMELDLDGFKIVNDSLGHQAGDMLLKKIAARLKSVLRSEDVVARMGGDEFVMVIENPPDAVDLGHMAEKIIASVAKPIDLDGSAATVTASIGIAVYPEDGNEAVSLLRAADTAMYASKQAGRNTFRYHDSHMAETAHRRLELEQGLHVALQEGQFELHYQPQIDMMNGALTGVEALLRWNHPTRGQIAPGEFITVAEETGLIIPIGEWVLREACTQAQAWTGEGWFKGTMSVNVAGQQFERGNIYETVKRVLEETGFESRRLVLEVTESILLKNAKSLIEELKRLNDLGVSLAIDDFGVGYSSLAYLKYLNAQGLKIDQSFVLGLPDDKNDTAIIRAIIAMARSMGFKLMAEGVELESQQTFLKQEGCYLAQGFLFSSPVSADEFGAWMRARKPESDPAKIVDGNVFARRAADLAAQTA